MSHHSYLILAFSPMTKFAPEVSLTPRKLPTQKRAAHTVAVILEAAAHILDTEGFGGYSTNAIAAKAGVSIGSIYQYFGNKEGITLALIEDATERLMETIEAAAVHQNPRVALDAMISAAVDHQLRRPQLAQLLDLEEKRLYKAMVRDDAVFTRLSEHVVRVVESLYGKHDDMNLFCSDIATICRSLCDSTGSRLRSRASLEDRVKKAVHGYLQEQMG